MNSRLWSLAAITLAVCLASSVLFANSSFAEDSPTRKAMKEKAAKQDEEKKAKMAAKKAEFKASKLKILQAKLSKYLADQASGNSTSIQQKLNDVKAKIAKAQKS